MKWTLREEMYATNPPRHAGWVIFADDHMAASAVTKEHGEMIVAAMARIEPLEAALRRLIDEGLNAYAYEHDKSIIEAREALDAGAAFAGRLARMDKRRARA